MTPKLLTSTIFIIFIAIGTMAQNQLGGREWRLTYLRGINIRNVTATISIDPALGKFTGNTGCNIMNGTMSVRRDSVRFKGVITTKRACTITTAPVEGGMLNGLNRADRFQVSRTRLRIYDRTQLLMEFVPILIPEPGSGDEVRPIAEHIGLEDRKWYLRSIANSPMPKVQEDAFIRFHPAEGSAGGDTSCNVFGGNFEANGDRFSFTQGISTMRACIEDERMNIERQFLDGLRQANRYEIRGNSLTLYHDRRSLLTFIGRAFDEN